MGRGRRTNRHSIPGTMRYLLRRSRLGFTVFDSGKSRPVETFTSFERAQQLCRQLNRAESAPLEPDPALVDTESLEPTTHYGSEVCEVCHWRWQPIPGGTHYFELTTEAGVGLCPGCEAEIQVE